MRLFGLLALAGLVAADAVSDLEAKGRPALDAAMAKSKTCSKDKLQVRREWYDVMRLGDGCFGEPGENKKSGKLMSLKSQGRPVQAGEEGVD
jgi:hypothetical protein